MTYVVSDNMWVPLSKSHYTTKYLSRYDAMPSDLNEFIWKQKKVDI